MPPSIAIRPAVIADFEALCALWEDLDEHHRRARPDLFRVPAGPRRDIEQVRGLVTGPDSTILLAETSPSVIAGLAALLLRRPAEGPIRVARPYVEIDNIAVASSARRLGIGRKLIEAARSWTMARGLGRLELTVYDFNEEALAFYGAAGFKTVSRRLALPV